MSGSYLTRLARGQRPLRSLLPVQDTRPRSGKPYWEGSLVVTDVIEEAVAIRTFRLRNPSGGPVFPFRGGQYLDVTARLDGEEVRRSYSISSSDQERFFIDITVKREPQGVMSGFLFDDVRPGTKLAIRGPFGQFTVDSAQHRRLVLIGAGVGVTPLVGILRSLCDGGNARPVTALFGFRDADHALFMEELRAMNEASDCLDLRFSWSQPKGDEAGGRGRLNHSLIKAAVNQPKKTSFFICGPNAMMANTRADLSRLGVRDTAIHEEAFSAGPLDTSLGGAHEISFAPSGQTISS